MQIISSFYFDVKAAIATFLRRWKNDPLERERRKGMGRWERQLWCALFKKPWMLDQRRARIKFTATERFQQLFRAIDPSRANSFKHQVMLLATQNSHLTLAKLHVVCFHHRHTGDNMDGSDTTISAPGEEDIQRSTEIACVHLLH